MSSEQNLTITKDTEGHTYWDFTDGERQVPFRIKGRLTRAETYLDYIEESDFEGKT